MTHAELETAYIALCKRVEGDTLRIMGQAGAGRATDAGRTAALLNEAAATARQQFCMEREQAGGYDLSALSVNASVPSNSETPFEDE